QAPWRRAGLGDGTGRTLAECSGRPLPALRESAGRALTIRGAGVRWALERRRERLTTEAVEHERLCGDIRGGRRLRPGREVEPDRQAPDEGRGRRRAVVAGRVGGRRLSRDGRAFRHSRLAVVRPARAGAAVANRAWFQPVGRAREIDVRGE